MLSRSGCRRLRVSQQHLQRILKSVEMLDNERRPILERQAVYEDEAAGAIASERGGGLRHEQAREHHVPFGRNEPCYRRC